MDVDALQGHLVLWEGVDVPFLCAPIEVVAPITDELLQVGEVRAVRPGCARRLVRETRAGLTLA